MKNKTKRLVTAAILVTAAMLFSFVESQIPPFIPVPGIKLGLANAVTVFALYRMSAKDAFLISILRVSLSSMLFGMSSLPYALSGAVLSLGVMLLLKHIKLSPVAVSAVGGIVHNAAQIGVAALILGTSGIIYYFPALALSGVITGTVIGIIAGIVIKKLKPELLS